MPRTPVMVSGDPQSLESLVSNLVSNAVKFTEDGGWVRCTLDVDDDQARLEVRDNGLGIPEAEQRDLFTRFFRSTTAHEHAIQGSGLGLTIVDSIVKGHGGEISVRLRAHGRVDVHRAPAAPDLGRCSLRERQARRLVVRRHQLDLGGDADRAARQCALRLHEEATGPPHVGAQVVVQHGRQLPGCAAVRGCRRRGHGPRTPVASVRPPGTPPASRCSRRRSSRRRRADGSAVQDAAYGLEHGAVQAVGVGHLVDGPAGCQVAQRRAETDLAFLLPAERGAAEGDQDPAPVAALHWLTRYAAVAPAERLSSPT